MSIVMLTDLQSAVGTFLQQNEKVLLIVILLALIYQQLGVGAIIGAFMSIFVLTRLEFVVGTLLQTNKKVILIVILLALIYQQLGVTVIIGVFIAIFALTRLRFDVVAFLQGNKDVLLIVILLALIYQQLGVGAIIGTFIAIFMLTRMRFVVGTVLHKNENVLLIAILLALVYQQLGVGAIIGVSISILVLTRPQFVIAFMQKCKKVLMDTVGPTAARAFQNGGASHQESGGADSHVQQNGGLSEELRCPVCLEMFNRATVLGCGHTFCAGCLEDMNVRGGDKRCPVCRVFITSSIRSITLDNVMRSIASN